MLREKLKFRRAFYPLKIPEAQKTPPCARYARGGGRFILCGKHDTQKHIVAATGKAGNAVFC